MSLENRNFIVFRIVLSRSECMFRKIDNVNICLAIFITHFYLVRIQFQTQGTVLLQSRYPVNATDFKIYTSFKSTILSPGRS